MVLLLMAIVTGFLMYQNNQKDYQVEKVTDAAYFLLKQDNKFGIITKEGTTIVEPIYDNIEIPNQQKPIFVCYEQYDEQSGSFHKVILNDKKQELFTNYEEVSPIYIEGVSSATSYEKNILQYKENGKYGVINMQGKKITKPIYDTIQSLPYKEGTLLVTQKEKVGVINNKGVILVPIQYDTITADGYYHEETQYKQAGFVVSIKTEQGYRYGYISAKGKKLLDTEYNDLFRVTEMTKQTDDIYIMAVKEGRSGLVKNKKVVVDFEYQDIGYNIQNNLFMIQKGDKQGVVDSNGKVILETKFDRIEFSGIYILGNLGEQVTIYDTTGKQLNTPYSTMLPTSDPNYYITSDKKEVYGVVDKQGKELIPLRYSYLEYIGDNRFIACSKEGKYGILDTTGKSVLEVKYDSIQKLRNTDVLCVVEADDTYLYNKNMEKTIQQQDAKVEVKQNWIAVTSKGKIRYVTFEGKEISNKEAYPDNLLYSIQKDGKWGFVDRIGNSKVECKYDQVTELNEAGFAGIQKDGKWGVIDKQGVVLVEPIYEIAEQNPQFIASYYRVDNGYGNIYYTNQEEE